MAEPLDFVALTGYKWTRPDGMSWHDATFGPYRVGATLTVPGATTGGSCGIGLHFSTRIEDAVGYGRFPGALWRVESDGPMLGQDDMKLRVVKAIEKPVWVTAVEDFLATMPTVPWFRPTAPPDPAWRHFPDWDSAWASARASARDSAWASAWASAWDSARASAWASARASARASAWASAWDSARASAGDGARASAGASAGLLAAMLCVCDRDDVPQASRGHAAQRWRVWTMGYGLTCDVDGVLYTYGEVPRG